MDICIVCLESAADIFSRINITSSEWKECNIQRIIEKHLWWWYLGNPTNDTMQWICRQCWQEISSFHNFYTKVEREHKHQKLALLKLLKCHEGLLPIKEEFKFFDNATATQIEDMVPLVKRKRSRKNKKSFECIDKLKIEEISTAEVKYEQDLYFIDTNENPKREDDITVDEPKFAFEKNDIMTTDSMDDIWEPNINYDNDEIDNTDINIFDSIQNDLTTTNASTSCKPTKSKRKPKSIKISKAKTKKPNHCIKNKKRKVSNISSTKSEVMKQNDEFLAEYKFELFCCLCNALLTDFKNLKYHYRSEHKISGYVMCCDRKWYKRGLLVDHFRVHQDPNYFKCTHCERILANRTNFENHLEYHKELGEPRELTFNCNKCDKSFFTKASYDRHQLLHVPEEDKKFQCTECEKKFATGYLLKQHIALTHSLKYAKICDICGKLFREKYSFLRHMGEHNGAPQAKVPCDICGVELTNKYLLNRHKKKLHTEANLQEQKCPYCSKVSPNMSAHRHHVQYSHTLQRKHACHMCDKKFKRPKELKEHLSVHTGEALYTCPHCPKTFISNGNMHKHRKLSHRKEWEEARLKKLTAQQLRALNDKATKNLNSTCTDVGVPTLQQSYPENLTMVNINELNF